MIDIVILSYNAGESINRLINSIIKHTDSKSYRLIVVDNASDYNIRSFLLKKLIDHNHELILLNRNYYFSGGANIGLRTAKSDLVMFFTNDTAVFDDDWLEFMKIQFEKYPRLGLLAPIYLNEPTLNMRQPNDYSVYESCYLVR